MIMLLSLLRRVRHVSSVRLVDGSLEGPLFRGARAVAASRLRWVAEARCYAPYATGRAMTPTHPSDPRRVTVVGHVAGCVGGPREADAAPLRAREAA